MTTLQEMIEQTNWLKREDCPLPYTSQSNTLYRHHEPPSDLLQSGNGGGPKQHLPLG